MTSQSRLQQDDFILTLSDGDDDGVEELPGSPGPSSKLNGQDDSQRGGQPRKRKKEHKLNGSPAQKSKRARLDDASLSSSRHRTDEQDGGSKGPQKALADNIDVDDAVDSDFEFAYDGLDTGVFEDFDGWEHDGGRQDEAGTGSRKGVNIEEIIARRRSRKATEAEGQEPNEIESNRSSSIEAEADGVDAEDDQFEGFDIKEDELLADDAFGMGATSDVEDEEAEAEADGANNHDGTGASESSSVASPMPHPDDEASSAGSDDEGRDDPKEEARRKAFFASEDDINTKIQPANAKKSNSFQSMSLSRPVLKGLAAVGFSEPTPIQAKAIPVALLGKDVVGGAVTGSGKTAAFLVPILERLLYRPRRVPTSRVAILMPTRELAVQCYNVAKRLAAFTDITFCRLVGGFSLREQENELKKRPDVTIATPGRFIDHMRNSASFTVETLEILVLDEADRMLQEGFADELNEILSTIPKSRQTMLFSATMTDSVDKLIRVGMTSPVRLMLDAKTQTVGTLTQEFIRLRPGREGKRMGYLMFLCKEIYTERAIVFFRQKKEAHRARIIFGLLGLKASELHGSMSQDQRIQNVEAFRDGKVSFLLATDLASRGLDIKGVQTVINYEAPQSHEIYLHRVGRTARAGRAGRACTLAAENDRKVVKSIVKVGRSQGAKIVSRVVETTEADTWAAKVEDLQDEVDSILREEKEERELAQVEMQVTRGDNIIKHEEEIKSRPKRTWFESERDKKAAQKLGSIELNGVQAGKLKEKAKGKLSGKQKKRAEARDQIREGKLWKKGKKDASAAPVGKKQKSKKNAAAKSRLHGKARS